MEQALNKIAGFLIFFGAALVAAMALAYLAHDELGIHLDVIRADALVSTLLFSGMLAIAVFSNRFGKPK